ncbi:unnamed protein product [Durusdinium trenchii]|uniref:Uncharacterized protein n=1 Tax=Durusdinium trenchii TaxID=1381693 RepID=A0ABP0KIB6_9DINO
MFAMRGCLFACFLLTVFAIRDEVGKDVESSSGKPGAPKMDVLSKTKHFEDKDMNWLKNTLVASWDKDPSSMAKKIQKACMEAWTSGPSSTPYQVFVSECGAGGFAGGNEDVLVVRFLPNHRQMLARAIFIIAP